MSTILSQTQSEGITIIGQKRHDMIHALTTLEPYKIASFSPFHFGFLKTTPLQVLLQTKAYESQTHRPSAWEFRTNNKVHLKVAIGNKGCIVGSWNFSQNSTNNLHEMICVIDRATHPHACAAIEEEFNMIWHRSNRTA